MLNLIRAACSALCLIVLCACGPRESVAPVAPVAHTAAAAAESAEEFVARVNHDLTALSEEAQAAGSRIRN